MSKDRLDVFMAHQCHINLQNSETLKTLSQTVANIEKHTVRVEIVERIAKENANTIKDYSTRIVSLEHLADFIKAARRMYGAIIFALVIGAGAAVWQVVKNDNSLQKTDIELLLKTIISAQSAEQNATHNIRRRQKR